MEIEQVRKDMIRRFTDLEPDLSPDVLSDDHYQTVYRTPFRARNARALTKYEEKHSIQFCMSCRDYDKSIDKIVVYRTYVTVDDNLLENKRDAWIRMQCFHCDFDLRFDKPAPKQTSPNEAQMREIQELMNQRSMSSQQAHELHRAAQAQAGLTGGFGQGMSAGEVQARNEQYNYEMRRMVDNAQLVAHPPIMGIASEPPPPLSIPDKYKGLLPDDIYRKLKKEGALS